ncbi:hypothetical protein EMPS_01366 [Entomortierella parvispora]|uniref:Uncharacterized protein n=1 Tax=Entomortierella parvispora TaxID=205924 RepID=A0A9P3H2V2_9FUNG|nr:hypothetical protein EMPS_01366 [Entomortierella parvispora]
MASRLITRTHLQRTLLPGLSFSQSLTTRSVSPVLLRAFATESGSGFLGRTHKDQKDLVHGEPSGPKIVTSTIPGPKTKAGLQHLDNLQDTRAATMMTDLNKSHGNYVVDLDGNTYLDCDAKCDTSHPKSSCRMYVSH